MDKIKNQLQVSVSNDGFVDEGDGVISFPNGLTITDDTTMRSGTSYDIDSLSIETYAGQLTADHQDSLGTLIGKTIGTAKKGNRVFVQGIKYAVKENPYARLAYDLLVGGFSNSFSIETIGMPASSADPVYRNHELVGLSQVVVPNNYNARINQFNEIVHNSLERSQQDGLDTSTLEEELYSNLELVSTEQVKDNNVDDTVEEESMAKEKEVNASEEPVRAQEIEETAVAETAEVETQAAETEVAEEQETVTEEAESTEKVEEETDSVEVDNGKWVDTEVVATTRTSEYVETEEEKASRQAERIAFLEAELAAVKAKEVSGDDDEVTVTVTIDADNAAEDKVENDAEAAEEAEEAKESVETETNKNKENLEMTKEEIAEVIANALKPIAEDAAAARELAQNAFDTSAKEPEFEAAEEVKNAYDGLSNEEMFAKQLNAAVSAERTGDVEARKTLNEMNARNLQALKDAKIVNNALTVEDLGNFIIGPELYNQIVGVRTNYQAIIDATQWRETNALEFAWLSRTDDINMTSVAVGALGDVPSPDTTDNRLKPVSVPAYGAQVDKLEELAAVTPISLNVIKFAAADVLADVAEGYRNDYDRKRAQLVIARLQQAVDANTQNKHTYDVSDGIIQFAKVVADLSDVTTVGVLVMNAKSLAMIKGAAIDANQESLLLEIGQGSILGTPFLIVPNDLLPTLNSTETKTFVVQGNNVTIDTAVFYADLRTFTGRSSGGLKYDVDGSASYEVGGKVYSAYQRNEVVLRGSFFRGGVVKDPSVVAAIPAVAVS